MPPNLHYMGVCCACDDASLAAWQRPFPTLRVFACKNTPCWPGLKQVGATENVETKLSQKQPCALFEMPLCELSLGLLFLSFTFSYPLWLKTGSFWILTDKNLIVLTRPQQEQHGSVRAPHLCLLPATAPFYLQLLRWM